MFDKLRNKIIIITMVVTTGVLIVAGSGIMFFSSTLRPGPEPQSELMVLEEPGNYSDQELMKFIKVDREEGEMRLLATLLSIGVAIEIIVFVIAYYLSEKIVEPVEQSYKKQKLFIANASHELKTPLAVIQANVEALDDTEDNKKWKDNIETEVDHANKLVLDLLQLAKIDAGGTQTETAEEFDLTADIQDHIDRFQPRFKGKISLKKSAAAKQYKLPRQATLQVLDILLDNAVKYGEKRISVTTGTNGFAVENDGATIPEKDRAKIFDRFYQTDKTREGSGLGLAIAKAVCEQNKWQINCESSGKQTRFTVKF